MYEETDGDEDKCIKDLLSEVRNLKYIEGDNMGKFNLGQSLDRAVCHCTEDIIVMMNTMGFYHERICLVG